MGDTYERYVRRLVGSPVGGVLGSNVADGERLGLHAVGIARALLKDAYRAGGAIDDLAAVEFFRLIGDVVLGREEGSQDYASRFATGSREFDPIETVTVVWPLPVLAELMSAKDRQRITGITGTMRSSGGVWERAIAAVPSEHRWFRPSPRAQFGQAFVWITATDTLGRQLSASPQDMTLADRCRDVLGLIHRQPETPPLHLVALRLPTSLVRRSRTTRPSFAEAGYHTRFSARLHSHGLPQSSRMGQTIDLGRFAAGEGLQNGAPERVMIAFEGAAFRSDELVRFDVLGPVTVTRGAARNDDDAAFSNAMRDGRGDSELLQSLL